jgi:hypothetical protein
MESRSLPHVLAAMRELRFSADSYLGCYAELIAHLRANIDRDVVYHRAILDGMEIWANVFAAS